MSNDTEFLAPPKGKISVDDDGQLEAALEAWASLAYNAGGIGAYGLRYRPLCKISEWADAVLLAARAVEDDPPKAWMEGENPLRLCWEGTFTDGRWFTLELKEIRGSEESLPRWTVVGEIRWETGTGKPSRFLGHVLGEFRDKIRMKS